MKEPQVSKGVDKKLQNMSLVGTAAGCQRSVASESTLAEIMGQLTESYLRCYPFFQTSVGTTVLTLRSKTEAKQS